MRAILAKIVDQLFTHPFESFCDSFFVFYALWTLTWIASYFANLSFSAISPIFFLLLPLSVLALALKPATVRRTAIAASRARRDFVEVPWRSSSASPHRQRPLSADRPPRSSDRFPRAEAAAAARLPQASTARGARFPSPGPPTPWNRGSSAYPCGSNSRNR